MKQIILDAIANGNNTRAAVKAKAKRKGALVTRVDATISQMLFAGELVSVGGVLRVAN